MFGNIFITSDLHFSHDRDFIYQKRGFKNVDEMNEAIIKNWNEVVDPEDEVYMLGDFMLNDPKRGAQCIRRLNGNITLICGNHDTSDKQITYHEQCGNIKDIENAEWIKFGEYRFFLSHFPTLCTPADVKKPTSHCLINLCGHVHTRDRWYDWKNGRIYHCEVDAHNMTPVAIEDIIADLNKKA